MLPRVSGGTQSKAFPLTGSYATFPQYNARAKRFITVQDRIEECFPYSMNGKALDYASPEMIALTADIAFLSRGKRSLFHGNAPQIFQPEPATFF